MKRKKLSCIALLLLMFFAFGIIAESASVVAAPIIGRWQFDEGIGGITLDSSGKEKTGTISSATWVEGIMDRALKFLGTGSHVQVPSSNLVNLSRWSLTAFVMPTGTKEMCVYSEKDSAGKTNLAINITTDNRIKVTRAGVFIGDTARNAVKRNEWNNIVVAYENGTVNCYVSGTTTEIAVRRVSLNKTEWLPLVGETLKLVATIFPANATNQNITWSSSNTGVATVDANGKVTARGSGTATITVKTEDGGYTATCTVIVVPVTGVSLNKTSTRLVRHTATTETLTATVSPANANNKNVTWSSSNTGVATVDANGKVTAGTAGTATITVRTVDGGKTATCAVTVRKCDCSVENYCSYCQKGQHGGPDGGGNGCGYGCYCLCSHYYCDVGYHSYCSFGGDGACGRP
jgi:uncharacterized protein YjdB